MAVAPTFTSTPVTTATQDQPYSYILITSDTIVWHNESALGKPKDNKLKVINTTKIDLKFILQKYSI